LEVAEASTISEVTGAIRDAASSRTTSLVRVRVPGRDSNFDLHESLNSLIAGRVTAALAKAD
jgi:hypothetical protein